MACAWCGVERDVPVRRHAHRAGRGAGRGAAEARAGTAVRRRCPPGTSLRACSSPSGGDAFVDLSKEAAAAHTGGSLDELFSVYAIVNALTVNLPAIARVQILVDGQGGRLAGRPRRPARARCRAAIAGRRPPASESPASAAFADRVPTPTATPAQADAACARGRRPRQGPDATSRHASAGRPRHANDTIATSVCPANCGRRPSRPTS